MHELDPVPPVLVFGLTLFSIIGGIALKMLWNADDQIREDFKKVSKALDDTVKVVADLRVEIAGSYVTREELRQLREEDQMAHRELHAAIAAHSVKSDATLLALGTKMEEGFNQLHDRLDGKADKPAGKK